MLITLYTLNIVKYALSHRQQKAPMTLDGYQGFANCEISMKQTASHSQTPTFVKNESNTKPVLYQHPTPAEMRTPRLAIIKANAIEAFIFCVFVILSWLGISLFVSLVLGG